MNSEKQPTIQIKMEANLKRQFRAACALEGLLITDVVNALIAAWLADRDLKN